MNRPSISFISLLLFIAVFMEGLGSLISIIGLSSLFTNDIIIILIAGVLDCSKIVTVSFLYQYWETIRRAMKYYMTAAVLVLMIITSGGAFGYLSAAFQKAVQPNIEASLKVDTFSGQQTALINEKKELSDLKISINKQIAAIPTENERARRQLIYSMKPELDRTNKRLEQVNTQLDDIRTKTLTAKSDNIEKDVHTGPIIYVSKAFNVSVEEASKYIILTIVSVFDPLAIMLVLAANFLIKKRNEEKTLPEPPNVVLPELSKVIPRTSFEPSDKSHEPSASALVSLEQVKTTPKPTPTFEQVIVPKPTPAPAPAPTSAPVQEPIVEVSPKTYAGSPQSDFIKELPVTLHKQGVVL